MIPPSSLARLVLGYLEEEGLQNTIQTFHQEYHEVFMEQPRDPFVQTPNLKTILEDYIAIKESVSSDRPENVIPSLWKNLDVLIGQLKYHTLANPTSLKPQKKYGKKKGYSTTYTLHSTKSKTKQPSRDNSTNVSKPQNDAKVIPDSPQSAVQPVQSVFVTGIHVAELQPNKQTASFPVSAPGISPMRSITPDTSSMNTSVTSSAAITQNDGHNSSSINSSVVFPASSICESSVTLQSEVAPFSESGVDRNDQGIINTDSAEGVELFSKSPKRKGHPPKKRHAIHQSPAKVSINEMCLTDTVNLQQLLDGETADTAMPLLLDAFLNTPILQEKLAENINKVVASSKPMEAQEISITETVQGTSTVVEETGDQADKHNEVPVDDVLSLLEADPVFESFFSMLATDGANSPTKESIPLPPCTASGPAPSTSNLMLASQSQQSYKHDQQPLSESNLSEPSTSTSVTLENSTSLVASKPLTPESCDEKKFSCDSQCTTDSLNDMHVRSLNFCNEETAPKGQLPKPKKARAGRPPNTTSKKKRCPKKPKKKAEVVIPKKLLLPNLSSPPNQPAVNLLQSLASVGRPTAVGNTSLDNRKSNAMKQIGGSSMLQLLQDVAVQQIQSTAQGPHNSHANTSSNLFQLTEDKSNAQAPVTPAACNTASTSLLQNNGLISRGNVLPDNQHHLMSQFPGLPYVNTSVQSQLNSGSQMSIISSDDGAKASVTSYDYNGQQSAPMQTTLMPITPMHTTSMQNVSLQTGPMSTTSLGTSSMQSVSLATPSLPSTPMRTSSMQSVPSQASAMSTTYTTPLQIKPIQNISPVQLLMNQLSDVRSSSSNALSSALNFSACNLNSFPSHNVSNQASRAITSSQTGNYCQTNTNSLPGHGTVNLTKPTPGRDNLEIVNQGDQLMGKANNMRKHDKISNQTVLPEKFSGQSSSESSPLSLHAEECVSSFCQISEFGKTQRQDSLKTVGSESNPSVSTKIRDFSASGKGKHKKNIKGKKSNKEEVLTGSNAKCGVDKCIDSQADTEESQLSPALSSHSMDSATSMEERRECSQGVKRQGNSDLKENKPKRPKTSRISKKSKKKKDLPKDFDVEKFLSRLHYVEKANRDT